MESFAPFLQELFKNSAEIVIFFAIAILTASLGRIKDWWKDRAIKRFERGINQNMRVQQLLAELRVIDDADRVSLYQFHNGDHYHSGESIMKCSLTHYVTRPGIDRPNPVQNMPTTHMLQILTALQDNKVACFQKPDVLDDSFLDHIFTASGINIISATAVRDSRKNWVGILCISWLEETECLLDDRLREYAKQVGEFIAKRS